MKAARKPAFGVLVCPSRSVLKQQNSPNSPKAGLRAVLGTSYFIATHYFSALNAHRYTPV